MTTKTMAEVLGAHPEPEVENGYWYCMCGHDYGVNFNTDTIYEHIAAALAAAGFGLVAEAKAEAWDEGATRGGELAAWAIGNRPYSERPDTTNPYRKEGNDNQ